MQTSAVDSWLEAWAKCSRALVHPHDAEYLKQKGESFAVGSGMAVICTRSR